MRRIFWLCSAVIFLDEALYLSFPPLLPTYSARFHLSNTGAGFMVSGYPLLMLASSIPVALFANRIGQRRLLLAGCVLLVVSAVGFGFADTAWELWTARALQGLTSGLTSTVGMALIVAGALQERVALIGLAASVQGLSTIAGPALGGFLAPALGVRAAFLATAALGAGLFAALLAWRWPEGERGAPAGSVRRRLAELLRNPAARSGAVCTLAVGTIGAAVQTLAPLGLEAHGYSTMGIGAVFTAGAALGFLSSPLTGRLADRLGTSRVALGWAAATPLIVLAFALPWRNALAVTLLVVLLPLFRAGGVLAYGLGAGRTAAGSDIAAAFGLVLAGWSAGAVLGPLVAGAAADAYGQRAAFAVTAALGGLLALALRRSTRPALEVASA